MMKCPNCNSDAECLGGCSAHHSNWYCDNCGWQAWDKDKHRIASLESELAAAKVAIEGRVMNPSNEAMLCCCQEDLRICRRMNESKAAELARYRQYCDEQKKRIAELEDELAAAPQKERERLASMPFQELITIALKAVTREGIKVKMKIDCRDEILAGKL